ncbi:hypothetical protein DFS34DRAFT_684848 [Phlyctochytrium arcticum]|nr:hypothetical protein DFS34DRAFT_684848 [Phlyctochytrium arcticum]
MLTQSVSERATVYCRTTPRANLYEFLQQDLPNLVNTYPTYDSVVHGEVMNIYRQATKECKRRYLLGYITKLLFKSINTAFETLKATPTNIPDIQININAPNAHQVAIGDNITQVDNGASKRKRQDSDDDPEEVDSAADVHISIKKKSFTIPSVNLHYATPNKPKMSHDHIHSLSRNIQVATGFSLEHSELINIPEALLTEFENNKEAGRLLEEEGLFWRILRYGLIALHGVLFPLASNNYDDHERTAMVDLVIPWLSPLRLVGRMGWRWCEFSIGSKRRDPNNDEQGKYADGLALEWASGQEVIFLESSGGLLKENVGHNMDDSVKLIESACYALREYLSNHKGASFASVSQQNVFILQVIRDRLTLSRVGVAASGEHWQAVELRSAKVPVSWSGISAAISVAELLATLYQGLQRQQQLHQQIEDEINGLVSPVALEDTAGRRLNWSSLHIPGPVDSF